VSFHRCSTTKGRIDDPALLLEILLPETCDVRS
jgi:hypothetical protein